MGPMNINEIKSGLSNGTLVLSDKKLFTRAEWDAIHAAEQGVEQCDLLQLTKKIQL